MEFGKWGAKAWNFILNPIENDAFINIMEGSVRSGKTVAMIPKWLEYIQDGPEGLLLMTGVSKETLYDNVLNDLFDVIGESNYEYNRQTGELMVFWIKDGKRRYRRIKVCGAKDEGSEKYLRGKTIAGAYCDEVSLMPEKFFKQLLNRLSVKGAKLYATTNPDSPFHYLYREYITDEKKLKKGMVKVYHFELDDNPNLPEEYKNNIREAYKGMWYKRMILGLWVIAEGIIYDMFSDDLLYDASDNLFTLTKKSECRRYIGIDYGTKNPMAFLDVYDDGETLFIENEYYYDSRKEQKQKSDEEYGKDFSDFVGDEYPDAVIIDPSAASFKVVLRGKGFRTRDADNDVNNGIRHVAMLMARKTLRINRRCENLIKEIHSYCWDEKAAEHGEEKPVKVSDHAADALRYVCNTMLNKWRYA